MQILTAPNWGGIGNHFTIFLAGGITGCPDWQRDAINMYAALDAQAGLRVQIANPRREDFELEDPSMSVQQIEWEYKWLRAADRIVFWFPEETLCPITLFELGAHLHDDIVVGAHPNYARRFDIVEQFKHARKDLFVYNELHDVVRHSVRR